MSETEIEISRAIVLLSGGIDSTTALAIAKNDGFECCALSFDYGQKQKSELAAAAKIARKFRLRTHKILNIPLAEIGGSALTDNSISVPDFVPGDDIPITYVPARNTIFLSFALAFAEVCCARAIFIGVNALDYSGYPDCREAYILAFERMAALATKRGISGEKIIIKTPLIDLKKNEIIETGVKLGVDYAQTVSCYRADENGRACGTCDACHYRRAGFEAAGIKDPTVYQTVSKFYP